MKCSVVAVGMTVGAFVVVGVAIVVVVVAGLVRNVGNVVDVFGVVVVVVVVVILLVVVVDVQGILVAVAGTAVIVPLLVVGIQYTVVIVAGLSLNANGRAAVVFVGAVVVFGNLVLLSLVTCVCLSLLCENGGTFVGTMGVMPSLDANVSKISEISCMLVALFMRVLMSFSVKLSSVLPLTSSEIHACSVLLNTLRMLPVWPKLLVAELFMNSHFDCDGKRLESSRIVGGF